MRHTHSRGPPTFVASSDPEQDLRARLNNLRAALRERIDQVRSPSPFHSSTASNSDPEPIFDLTPPVDMAARRTVHDHISVTPTIIRSSILLPQVEANSWTIPPT